MKLSKTELTGLGVLALLIVAITGTAVALRRCSGPEAPPPAVEAVAPADTVAEAPTPVVKVKTREKKSSTRRSRKTSGKSSKQVAPSRNPFADTIPTL